MRRFLLATLSVAASFVVSICSLDLPGVTWRFNEMPVDCPQKSVGTPVHSSSGQIARAMMRLSPPACGRVSVSQRGLVTNHEAGLLRERVCPLRDAKQASSPPCPPFQGFMFPKAKTRTSQEVQACAWATPADPEA